MERWRCDWLHAAYHRSHRVPNTHSKTCASIDWLPTRNRFPAIDVILIPSKWIISASATIKQSFHCKFEITSWLAFYRVLMFMNKRDHNLMQSQSCNKRHPTSNFVAQYCFTNFPISKRKCGFFGCLWFSRTPHKMHKPCANISYRPSLAAQARNILSVTVTSSQVRSLLYGRAHPPSDKFSKTYHNAGNVAAFEPPNRNIERFQHVSVNSLGDKVI